MHHARMDPNSFPTKSPDTFQEIILDSINEGVFTVDRQWRVMAFNRAAERITGIARSEAVGRLCSEVFRASICETACALGRTLQTGESTVNVRADIINAAGDKVPVRISTALLRSSDGTVLGGVETFQDLTRTEILRKQLEASYTFEDIIGRSPAMRDIFRIIPQVAESDSTVLLEGASGTGKELFARAIHNLSPRRNKRFAAINCGALPDSLVESELFGYKAGAFTGARKDYPGRFVGARGGTIFLDEIGDISPAMQVRLLRVLQERVVQPLGGLDPVPVNVRVVAATHEDLWRLVGEGRFREDLYYRIKVVHLNLPPLSRRREDIPLLVDHLITRFNHLQGKDIAGVSHGVMARLMEHDYPGNVRELENIIEQAFVLCRGGLIETAHLPRELRGSDHAVVDEGKGAMSLSGTEKMLIEKALARNRGNRKLTAADLGIDPSTLYRKIRRLGMDVPDRDGRHRKG
ncbi:MAG: sigma-54 interaction domain-containing protein [Desulfatibacillaceae bacterium]